MGLTLGRYSYIATHILSHDPDVRIGNFSSLAANITFHGRDNHTIDTVATFPLFTLYPEMPDKTFTKGPIVIGNDVWVGDKVVFMSGVTVGDGAVIGANAVVTKDCEPYGVYAGNPARCKKKRFSYPGCNLNLLTQQSVIQNLLQIKWWDWPDKKIKENIEWFFKPVEEFVQEFRHLRSV